MKAPAYRWLAVGSLALLMILCVGWEMWWAPLRPEGSRLALKGAILIIPLVGILSGQRYTFKWMTLFIQLYLLEGLVRATTEHGLSQWLAIGETLLATAFFVSGILYIRATRHLPAKEAAKEKAAQSD